MGHFAFFAALVSLPAGESVSLLGYPSSDGGGHATSLLELPSDAAESWWRRLTFDTNHSVPHVETAGVSKEYLPKANPNQCLNVVNNVKLYSICFASGGKNPKIDGDKDHYEEDAWTGFARSDGLPKALPPLNPDDVSCRYCPTTGFWPEAERSMMLYCPNLLLVQDDKKEPPERDDNNRMDTWLMKRCTQTGIDLNQDAVLYRGLYRGNSPDRMVAKYVLAITTFIKGEKGEKEKLAWPGDQAKMMSGIFKGAETSDGDFGSSFETFNEKDASFDEYTSAKSRSIYAKEGEEAKADVVSKPIELEMDEGSAQKLKRKQVQGLWGFQMDFNDVTFCTELCVPENEGKCMSTASKDCTSLDREAPGITGTSPCAEKCSPCSSTHKELASSKDKTLAGLCCAKEDKKYHDKITQTMLTRMREGINEARKGYMNKCGININKNVAIRSKAGARKCCAGGAPHHVKGLVKCFLCRLLAT